MLKKNNKKRYFFQAGQCAAQSSFRIVKNVGKGMRAFKKIFKNEGTLGVHFISQTLGANFSYSVLFCLGGFFVVFLHISIIQYQVKSVK